MVITMKGSAIIVSWC